MKESNIYSKVLKLSLFTGLSESELEHIFGSFRFGFHHFEKGTVVVKEGKLCESLLLLTDGDILTERWAEKHNYRVEEFFSAPHVLQPERLFGIAHAFSISATALTDVNIISIDKSELQRLLDSEFIVKLNFLNMLSAKIHHAEKAVWLSAPESLTGRIRRFVWQHTESLVGRKVVHIKMTELAHELNDNRLNTSKALHQLADAGLITLYRNRFVVEQMDRFLTEKSV